ncbi:hypothetical protein WA158_001490 [Blastocystis sp. Blastoise]
MDKELTKFQFWIMTTAVYFTCFVSGFADSVRGVAIPVAMTFFNADNEIYGLYVTITLFGYVIFSSLSGFLEVSIGFKWSLVIGCICCFLGSVTTIFVNDFRWILVTQSLTMAGVGTVDTVYSSLGTYLFTEHIAVYMSIMGVLYGVGGMSGSFIAGVILEHYSDYSFRGVYFFVSIILLIISIIVSSCPFALRFPPKIMESEQHATSKDIIKQLGKPSVWLFSLCIMMLMLVERAPVTWSNLYIQNYLHMDISIYGSLFNTVFYLIYTISRAFSGFITEWIGYFNVLYITISIVIILLIIGFSINEHGYWVLCSTGAFVTFFYSTMLCIIVEYFKIESTVASSVIIPLESLLLALSGYPLGILNEKIGDEWAFRSTVIFAIIAMLLVLIIHYELRKKNSQVDNTQTTLVDHV